MTLLETTTDLGFTVRPLSGTIGAEIEGLDLQRLHDTWRASTVIDV